jgi:hypothetical protein
VRIRPVYQMLYGGGSFSVPRSSAHWLTVIEALRSTEIWWSESLLDDLL